MMAGRMQMGGHCPLCTQKGRQGTLELRQINASEALWICGNLQCPYPVYLEALTVSSIVPELLNKRSQTRTTGDHSWRNLATGSDQSDQMATSAASPDQCQDFSHTSPTSLFNSHAHSAASYSEHTTFPGNSYGASNTWSLDTHTTHPTSGDTAALAATNPGFDLTLMEPGNILEELCAMFDGTSNGADTEVYE